MSRSIPLAISPCPNDTFLFWAFLESKIETPFKANPTFADVQHLNEWAEQKRFPLTKLSIHGYGFVAQHYQLLPIGMALGFGVGPKLISSRPLSLKEISSLSVALPGKKTTACLLFEHFFERTKEKIYCSYDKIFHLLREGEVDVGVIIHESRFTFQNEGFFELADLGLLWQQRYNLPLPLGGLALDKQFAPEDVQEIVRVLRTSLCYARAHRKEALPFIRRTSHEQEESVIEKHIDLYVNEETLSYTSQGKKAIETLLTIGSHLGHYEAFSFCDAL